MKVLTKLKLLISVFALTFNVSANSFPISNTSVVKYQLLTNSGSVSTDIISQNSVTINTVPPKPVSLFVGSIKNNPSGTGNVSPSMCSSNQLNNPVYLSGSNISLPIQADFINESTLKSGDPLFIRIHDENRNVSPTSIDSLNVNITTQSGDLETITIFETGINTSDFIGFIQTKKSPVVSNNCLLSVTTNQKITVSYVDVSNQNTVLQTTILVDPMGVVFDSSNGLPVNGVTVSLINTATNSPAQVFGDDGVSLYPVTVVSGQDVSDSNGNIYHYNAGEFRFPLVAVGNYKLLVTPPNTYSFPSTVSDVDLISNFGGTHTINSGSKGNSFPVTSGVVVVDVPIDPKNGLLIVNKTASSNVAAIGDFIQYQVTVQNAGNNNLNNVLFTDILPKGFKYQKNSFKINNTKFEPQFNGKNISYNIGTINPLSTINIKYVTEITVNSSLGTSTNIAFAENNITKSNIANHSISIKDDLLRDKAIITGTVFESKDCNPDNFKRVENAKIIFETGDYVVSDKNGLWHIDSLSPITHVAKIDKTSLPIGYEAVLCENNNQFAGKPDLRFIDSTPGSIKRADFYIRKTKTVNKNNELVKELSISDLLQSTPTVTEIYNNKTSESIVIDSTKAGTEALSYNDFFLGTMVEGEEKLLFPNSKFSPQVMAIGVAYQYQSKHTVKGYVNGEEIDAYNNDGIRENSTKTMSIFYWRSVPIKEGQNTLTFKVYDENKNLVKEDKKTVSFSNNIAQAIFVPSESNLIANGNSTIDVAIRMIDEFGNPVHRGMSGLFNISGDFIPYVDRTNGISLDLVNRIRDNKNEFLVGNDGIAIIKLQPTNQGGEATISIKLKNKESIIRPWITTENKEWILVGIAEGTLAYNNIKNHMNGDIKGMEVVEGNDKRIAFYSKGTIKGDYLLTMAYDNKHNSITDSQANEIKKEIYDIYGDTTISKKDAATSKKLFVRIEKNKFYAMFGDFNTNFSVTELTKYQRNLNGFKTEYKGLKFSYSLFAANSSSSLEKEEIPSDGTTGFFRTISGMNPYSESVSIITRDRNQRDKIISTTNLTRFVDYDIDYDLGTIRLFTPVPVYDNNFNPNFIRVDYASANNKNETLVTGARVAYKINDSTEIGITNVSEKNKINNANMTSVDISHESEHHKLKFETALSNKSVLNNETKGKAYNAEYQYQDNWGTVSVYSKKVEKDYGVISNISNDLGIDKQGIDTKIKVDNDTTLSVQALNQSDLNNDSNSKSLEARVDKQINKNLNGFVGIKTEKTSNPEIISSSNTNSLSDANTANTLYSVGGQYKLNDIPARLNSQIEQNQNSNNVIPSKYKVNFEYDINDKVTFSADKEYIKYKDFDFDLNKAGVKINAWTGGKIQLYTGITNNDESNSFYQAGINQNLKFNNWNVDGSFVKQEWAKDLQSKIVIPSGSLINFDSFNVFQLGATYRNDPFVYQGRAEYRNGDKENKELIRNDIFKKIDNEYAVSVGHEYQHLTQEANDTELNNLKFGFSYRDTKNIDTIFSRLDYSNGTINNQANEKLIFNTHYNYKPNLKWEVTNHIGTKYNITTFEQDEYSGFSVVFNSGIRYYVNDKLDLGIGGLYAKSFNSNVESKGITTSIGYSFAKNTWVSLNYQKLNNYDNNFNFNEEYIDGFYIKFRLKFDEESFHLNKQSY